MTKPVVYLAGPMTGIDHFNFELFCDIASDLRPYFEVINPAEHDVEEGFSPWDWTGLESQDVTGFDVLKALNWDLEQIRSRADAVIILPFPNDNWVSSGVEKELVVAKEKNIPTLQLEWGDIDQHIDVRLTAHDEVRYTLGDKVKPVIEVFKASLPVKTWAIHIPENIDELRNGGYIHTDIHQAWQDNITSVTTGKTTVGVKPAENRWTGEVRTVSSTGGQKGVKPERYDLIPTGPLRELALHYGAGAEKYDDNQWRKGYEWSKSFAALMRHAQQFWGGEDFDEETGSNHMAAVAWHAFTLLEFYQNHKEFDDRFTS